ncbi:MAG: HPr family phosphocarrier protein [Defluviitaleaceae bacterium]|nr:HPr family phosphocarrier protein [Defluviitaleaceae bacterium]
MALELVSKALTIKNENGLHVRPAGALVSICRPFDADVKLKFNEIEYNLKSVLGIVSAGIKSGDAVEFICIGAEAAEALEAIVEAVESGLLDVQ